MIRILPAIKRRLYAIKRQMAVVYVQVPMPAHDIACPECGTEVHLPKIHNGRNAFCPVCHYQLASVPFNPYLSPIAFSSASLVFMFLALSFTFMGVKVGAASFNMNMPQAAVMLLREDYQFLAYVLLTTLLLTPALLLMGTLYTYYPNQTLGYGGYLYHQRICFHDQNQNTGRHDFWFFILGCVFAIIVHYPNQYFYSPSLALLPIKLNQKTQFYPLTSRRPPALPQLPVLQ